MRHQGEIMELMHISCDMKGKNDNYSNVNYNQGIHTVVTIHKKTLQMPWFLNELTPITISLIS